MSVIEPAEASVSPAPGSALILETPQRSPKRRGLGPLSWSAAGIVAVLILLAILAPVLPLANPNAISSSIGAGPSLHHLFGTDDIGRDMLSRVIWGSRVSLLISFLSILFAMVIGGGLGLMAAYFRGWVDTLISALSYVVLAFPPLLFIIVTEAFWTASSSQGQVGTITWPKLVVLFTVVGSPLLLRVVRASALSVIDREFVVAARTIGAGPWRVLVREILPNVAPAAVSFALIGVALFILLEGALAFLGLSVALPSPSLGNIINEGAHNSSYIAKWPQIWLAPSIYLFLIIVCLNLLGDRMRSLFDVRIGNL